MCQEIRIHSVTLSPLPKPNPTFLVFNFRKRHFSGTMFSRYTTGRFRGTVQSRIKKRCAAVGVPSRAGFIRLLPPYIITLETLINEDILSKR